MAGTYKVVELVGTSPTSFAEATKAAIAEASKTIRHMDWFEVVSERGRIVDGKVEEFQVALKVRIQDRTLIPNGQRRAHEHIQNVHVEMVAGRHFQMGTALSGNCNRHILSRVFRRLSCPSADNGRDQFGVR